MAVDFPSNPNPGDTVTDDVTGTVWMWDGVKWTFGLSGGGGGGGQSPIIFSPTPPANPSQGGLWWNTDVSKLYVFDGTQWVVVINTPEGEDVAPANLISTEAGNTLALGTDDLLYVPTPAGGGPPYQGPTIGVTDGSNAAPGMVGEYLEIVFPQGSPVVVDWGRTVIVATLNLSPGDWDVWGTVVPFGLNAGDVSCSFAWITTVQPQVADWPSFGPQGVAMYGNVDWVTPDVPSQIMAINPIRVSVAAATPVYLATFISGSGGVLTYTCAVFLAARRMR